MKRANGLVAHDNKKADLVHACKQDCGADALHWLEEENMQFLRLCLGLLYGIVSETFIAFSGSWGMHT